MVLICVSWITNQVNAFFICIFVIGCSFLPSDFFYIFGGEVMVVLHIDLKEYFI